MSRTSKLNETEAKNVLALKGKVPVDKLIKKTKLSRSTIYRIFDGSYHARPDAPCASQNLQNLQQMDELTISTVQFVLAKTRLEQLIGKPILIH